MPIKGKRYKKNRLIGKANFALDPAELVAVILHADQIKRDKSDVLRDAVSLYLTENKVPVPDRKTIAQVMGPKWVKVNHFEIGGSAETSKP